MDQSFYSLGFYNLFKPVPIRVTGLSGSNDMVETASEHTLFNFHGVNITIQSFFVDRYTSIPTPTLTLRRPLIQLLVHLTNDRSP